MATEEEEFRNRLLELYNNCCCICFVDNPDLLEVTRVISEDEDPSIAYDPRNALVFCLLHAKAYEVGLFGIHVHNQHFSILSGSDLGKQSRHVKDKLFPSGTMGALHIPISVHKDEQYRPLPEYLNSHCEKHNLELEIG